jgi:hypothetical protein
LHERAFRRHITFLSSKGREGKLRRGEAFLYHRELKRDGVPLIEHYPLPLKGKGVRGMDLRISESHGMRDSNNMSLIQFMESIFAGRDKLILTGPSPLTGRGKHGRVSKRIREIARESCFSQGGYYG